MSEYSPLFLFFLKSECVFHLLPVMESTTLKSFSPRCYFLAGGREVSYGFLHILPIYLHEVNVQKKKVNAMQRISSELLSC